MIKFHYLYSAFLTCAENELEQKKNYKEAVEIWEIILLHKNKKPLG